MLEKMLLDWLRVPPEPAAPDGSPGSVKIFRAGRNYYRWRILTWAFSHVAAVVGLLIGLASVQPVTRRMPPAAHTLFVAAEAFGVAVLIAGLPFSFYVQRLNYRMRWYIVTDRSLRIRSGIWSVEELTMTFANIQDIGVTAGPLQGLLGLADLEVRSAGGGGGSGPHGEVKRNHAARFEGVDQADALRDLITERLRQYRDAGLGDPDHHVPSIHDPHESALLVLAEARALRSSIG
jgi:uncharacterized membrane protein YdbT with pleckstrin-like domain